MIPSVFFATLGSAAVASAAATGIPAGFTLAQGALESEWGASRLAVQGCNLFGVKADVAWHGETISFPTEEDIAGREIRELASWRKYASWLDCLNDHAAFFINNSRYAKALQVKGDSKAFAQAIAAAGYATDPHYAQKLCALIDQYDLTQYDRAAPEQP